MKKIGLISDTHSYIDTKILNHFKNCDEIWHAGDIGDIKVTDAIAAYKPLKAVYGNIDGTEARLEFPKILVFNCEKIKVLILHIGGYPAKYNKDALKLIKQHRPQIFICGHSHILKIIYDKKNELLHLNPGAAGKSGFHQIRTLLRFEIDGFDIKNMEIIELGKR